MGKIINLNEWKKKMAEKATGLYEDDTPIRFKAGSGGPRPRRHYSSGKKKEPFGWTEYRDWVKKELPLFRANQLSNIWKIPAYNILHWGLKYLSEEAMPVKDRDNVLKALIGGFIDGYKTNYKKQASLLPYKIFPKLRVWMSFAEGATNVDELYTYQHTVNGVAYEFPVFARANPEGKDPKDPSADELKKNIDLVREKNVSIYDKMETEESSGFLNPDAKAFMFNKLTRLDYKRYFQSEPERAHRWAFKDDMWEIYREDMLDLPKMAAVNATLPAGYSVKIFKRPTAESGIFYNIGKYLMFDTTPRSGKMFLYWLVRDLSYDVIDTIMDPGEYAMRVAGIPEESRRDYVELGWKASAASTRALLNGAPPNLRFAA
jgi:hypothetical protein